MKVFWISSLCHFALCMSLWSATNAQAPLKDYRRKRYPEVPFMTLEDHNITYLELQGLDPQTDKVHPTPEDIIVRLFLAAQHQGSQIKLKITVMRESLAQELEFGHHCSPKDQNFCTDWYWQCPSHAWQPQITLKGSTASFPVQFMTDAAGVWPYLQSCQHYSDLTLWQNAHPYYAQAMLPHSAAGQTFNVSLAGFTQLGTFTLQPQTMPDPSGPRPVWNIMKLPGVNNNDRVYASSLAMNVEYHMSVGYAGTLALVSFKDAVTLLTHRQASHLIKAGKLLLLLWEGYAGCQGYVRCYAEDRFALKWPVAYQPLQFTVASLFLWRFNAYASFADMDEFLMIQHPGKTVLDMLHDPTCWAGLSQVSIPHHSIQTREPLAEGHWDHWYRRRKHSFGEVLSEYIYRSVRPDESTKPLFWTEDTISCHPHFVILQGRGHADRSLEPKTQDSDASCAVWGHVRDWWDYRGLKWVNKTLTPQEDKHGLDWIEDSKWMWALNRGSLAG